MTHRLGLIGIGSVADTHARGVAPLDGVSLVAASCRTRSRGETFAETYDCAWYADYERMLADADLDAVLVCTPSGAHLDPVRAAANAGVDVLCEKPLEITTARVDEMIAACEDAGVRLGGVFQNRYRPTVRALHEAAAAGRFGPLAAVNAYVPSWRDDDYYRGSWHGTRDLDGGGALINQTIHSVDVAQWVAGAAAGVDPSVNPVASVSAETARRAHDERDVEVEDTAVLTLRYRDGTLGQVFAATSAYPGMDRRIQVGGRDGSAELVEGERETWSFREDGAGDAVATDDVSEYGRNVEAFCDAVANDDPYALDAREARKAVEIVEAAYESAASGERVELGASE